MKKILVFLAMMWLFVSGSMAQVAVDISGYGVHVQTGKGTNITVDGGRVESDVQMEGVDIINDKVFIDGDEVPKGKKVFISRKTKKTYLIQWGKDGNVSVSEK